MNKLFVLIILLFTILSCSNTNNFEGQITFIEAGVVTELNDSKEMIWAEDKDIDIFLKSEFQEGRHLQRVEKINKIL